MKSCQRDSKTERRNTNTAKKHSVILVFLMLVVCPCVVEAESTPSTGDVAQNSTAEVNSNTPTSFLFPSTKEDPAHQSYVLVDGPQHGTVVLPAHVAQGYCRHLYCRQRLRRG